MNRSPTRPLNWTTTQINKKIPQEGSARTVAGNTFPRNSILQRATTFEHGTVV